MPTKLRVVIEKSTKMIIVSFFDENGVVEDIKTMTWTLSDKAGIIINDREDEEVETPGSVETIVLSGDDLAIMGSGGDEERFCTVKATYDSTLGNDLPLNGVASFTVIDETALANGITP